MRNSSTYVQQRTVILVYDGAGLASSESTIATCMYVCSMYVEMVSTYKSYHFNTKHLLVRLTIDNEDLNYCTNQYLFTRKEQMTKYTLKRCSVDASCTTRPPFLVDLIFHSIPFDSIVRFRSSRDEEDGVLVAKEGEMEKRKVQEAVAEWQAEKRRRVEDGEEEADGDDDDEDVQDVQVRFFFFFGVPACVLLCLYLCRHILAVASRSTLLLDGLCRHFLLGFQFGVFFWVSSCYDYLQVLHSLRRMYIIVIYCCFLVCIYCFGN